MNHRTLAMLIIGIAMVSTISAAPEPADKKTKEEKQVEKEQKADQKNADRYDKVKEYALNKYKTDPDFRDAVDRAFDEKMREHTEEAYSNNIGRESHLVAVHEDTWRMHSKLYDNLMVQDHVNRIGQRLVPPDSDKLYAFKVIPSPTPMARALSTGTVYVSTGLISLLDSEAQLSYVLAHEMAHVYKDHWKEQNMMELGEIAYNEDQAKKVAKITGVATLAGGLLGAGIGKSAGAAMSGALIGGAAGFVVGSLMNKGVRHVEWDKVQEDDADEMAFKAVLNSRYDVREVPKLYLALDKAAAKDARLQLGFMGQRKRVKQRIEKAENLIANSMKAEIELKAKNGFVSSSAEHRNLMAELKRDNGILAYYHDMFDMARTNLGDAVAIRDNDPAAHYFYAKTLKLVGRTDDDARMAKESFFKATKADSRRQNYGSHLHLALMMARENGVDPKQVSAELDTYVTNYARWNAEARAMSYYPPNLDSIYEYINMYGGDPNWKPKVPDLRELQNYRVVADQMLLAPTPAVNRQAVATVPSGNQGPATAVDQIKNQVNQVNQMKKAVIPASLPTKK